MDEEEQKIKEEAEAKAKAEADAIAAKEAGTAKEQEIVKAANEVAEKQKEAETMKAANIQAEGKLLERKEALAKLGGTSNAGQPTIKKEETPHEYRVRVEKELAGGKTEFGD